MSSTVFKRLFEIQVLHDYFLTTADGTTFFERNEAEKKDLIIKKLTNTIYDVRDMFEIEPIGSTNLRMSEYKLIVGKTALGFIVGTEVTAENLVGELVYKPRSIFPNNVNLIFSVRPRFPFFKSISNISLRPPLPSIYYLTNKDKVEFDESTLPPYKSLPLANAAMTHQIGKTYEMGALVDFGGTLREALQYTDGSDASHWEDIEDRRVMTDADRILLPKNFHYTLKKELGITQIDLILEDLANNPIKAINKSGADPFENVLLNFTKVDENDESSDDIPIGFYNLKIKLNAGAEVTYPIYLNDELYNKNYMGVIDIRFDEPASPFSLLDAGGFLKTRINALGEKVSHPVFELRFENRRTYWRYHKEGDFSPAEIAATAAHLSHTPERLISIKPKALTQTLLPFQNGASLMLPHPAPTLIRVGEEKIFSEIYINQSNRLLNT